MICLKDLLLIIRLVSFLAVSSEQTGKMTEFLGDVVDLHYFLYKQDIQRINAFGGNAYSFSYVQS